MERIIRDNLCTPSINIPSTTKSISGDTDAGEKFNLPEDRRFPLPNVESSDGFRGSEILCNVLCPDGAIVTALLPAGGY